MDLIAYVLAKKNAEGGGSVQPVIPTIGEDGHWYINGVDTGFRAVPEENIEVDGTLKVDTTNQNIKVVKNGVETIVGEAIIPIDSNLINSLF